MKGDMFGAIEIKSIQLTLYRFSDIMVLVMKMTINEKIKEKGISRYRLSKKSGIAWATLSDICSGKTKLSNCSVKTLQKLAAGLDIGIEDVLRLETGSNTVNKTGKPVDLSYLETNLSEHLKKAIDDYIKGDEEKVTYMDCLWCELYGSINADLWSGVISEEQAKYLREKYLFEKEQED